MTERQFGAWLQALKSGTYRQLQRNLYQRYPKMHCCLGVAAEVLRTSKVVDELAYPSGKILPHQASLTIANDADPSDAYARVICLLETSPEIFITSREE